MNNIQLFLIGVMVGIIISCGVIYTNQSIFCECEKYDKAF